MTTTQENPVTIPPPDSRSLAFVKDGLNNRLAQVLNDLTEARTQRDEARARITVLEAERRDIERVLGSFERRTRTRKPKAT